MKRASLLGAALAMAPLGVMAADLAPARVVAAPPVIVQFNQWGGFYGGLSVGWRSNASNGEFGFAQAVAGQPGFVGDVFRGEAFLAAQQRFDERFDDCDKPCVRTDDQFALPVIPFDRHVNNRDGFVGTLNMGYNWQFGAFVVGMETDVSFLNSRNRSAFYGAGTADYEFNFPEEVKDDKGKPGEVERQAQQFKGVYDMDASFAGSARMNWLSTARLRAGFGAGPFLLYATGGLAVGGVQMRADGFVNEQFRETLALGSAPKSKPGGGLGEPVQQLLVTSNTVWNARRSSNGEFGWTIGAGAEWKVSSGFSLKAEYLYYDLGDATLTATGVTTTSTTVRKGETVTTTRAAAPVTLRQDLDGHIFRVGFNFGFPVAPRPVTPVVAAY